MSLSKLCQFVLTTFMILLHIMIFHYVMKGTLQLPGGSTREQFWEPLNYKNAISLH